MSLVRGEEPMSLLRRHLPHDFDPEDFLIAGSARLSVDGIIRRSSDLDLLARPGSKTWQRMLDLAFEHASIFENAPLRTSGYTGEKIALLYGGAIEVCETWVVPGTGTELLLDQADVIEGLKYLSICEVVAYKLVLNRKKDFADLSAICGRPQSSDGRSPINSEPCEAVVWQPYCHGGRHGNPTA